MCNNNLTNEAFILIHLKENLHFSDNKKNSQERALIWLNAFGLITNEVSQCFEASGRLGKCHKIQFGSVVKTNNKIKF